MIEVVVAALIGILGFVVTGFVLGGIVALPTMWLWNWLMPELFHLATISFWQAWGLLFLSALLLKSGSSSTDSSKS